MDKLNIERLKKTLHFLESKQRELKRNQETDVRSLESMIKYLKKDIVEQFKLLHYDLSKQEVKNTDTFIDTVKNIIDSQF